MSRVIVNLPIVAPAAKSQSPLNVSATSGGDNAMSFSSWGDSPMSFSNWGDNPKGFITSDDNPKDFSNSDDNPKGFTNSDDNPKGFTNSDDNPVGYNSWGVYAPREADPVAPDPAEEKGLFSPPPNLSKPISTTIPSLPTDVVALQSIIGSLRAELKATTTVNTHLAASVARLQAEQAPPTPSSISSPFPFLGTIASGRGAASPEVLQEMIQTNWHGRLGRTHMVEVDGLSPTALTELDCFLRRKLHAIYPRDRDKTVVDPDTIFASLAALGLRLEDRGPYADVALIHDSATLRSLSTIKRGRKTAARGLTHEKYAEYWEGFAMETLVELARYRGLFDDEGFLKE